MEKRSVDFIAVDEKVVLSCEIDNSLDGIEWDDGSCRILWVAR